MNRFGKTVVRLRVTILIMAVLLLVPATIGYFKTRINYDVLTYLPKNIETMKGQKILANDFGTGAFSLVVIEGKKDKEVVEMKKKIENVDHVKAVLWYDSFMDISIPEEMVPDEVYKAFRNGDATLMAVLFNTTMSSDETMGAIEEIRDVTHGDAYISGMSALVTDTKLLSDEQVPKYVVIAVILSLIVLGFTMDSFLVPVFFMISIGMAIIYNLGTNVFKGEISYITQALAAVLQLAVTMDYSIFLWHSYSDERQINSDKNEAMAEAIEKTLSSVVGSSITTVAGFVALCFMSFTLGLDLGIVMAKGVIIGVISCVTILPALILVFDKAIEKTSHKPLIPNFDKLSKFVVKKSWLFILIFIIVLAPAYIGYKNTKVYYDLDTSLPQKLDSIVANKKLKEKFDMNSTHLLLVNGEMDTKDINEMILELDQVAGVKKVLGMESIIGPMVPREMIPENIKSVFNNGEYEMLLVMSEYKLASDEVNRQCDEINTIIKKYDNKAMLIGEAPCTKDLIEITDKDFNRVNGASIFLVAIIVLLVFKSLSVPMVLVCVIEFAIFINLGIPYYTDTVLPFVASIVIGTIQLGSTVDYGILMTNKFKEAKLKGLSGSDAAAEALSGSINSVIVSALTFFAATFGVGIYSDIDMISSLCVLMARGAVISMIVVIFILPAFLRLFSKVITATSLSFKEGNVAENKYETSDYDENKDRYSYQ
ncbi:efflux RND transporter permease subunit [Eubacterium ruminantium]|uniref:efflux RND transporter permease subunit n=1 Tax=Eubacterium ruminantium TaxID=42322 RepID=UPI001569111F|nr:MMPL family transporter [Eubacterium ruminantium]